MSNILNRIINMLTNQLSEYDDNYFMLADDKDQVDLFVEVMERAKSILNDCKILSNICRNSSTNTEALFSNVLERVKKYQADLREIQNFILSENSL